MPYDFISWYFEAGIKSTSNSGTSKIISLFYITIVVREFSDVEM